MIQKITTYGKEKNVNGWIMPLYKKTDPLFAEYDLRFIYASAISPGCVKGPHLHKKRECRLLAISGAVTVTVRRDGKYEDTILDSKDPDFLIIEAGYPFLVKNTQNIEAIILNLSNHIWTENDNDNHAVTDWNL